MSDRARAKVPARAVAGETIELRTLLRHRMESGERVGEDGARVPRLIANRFVAAFDGEPFFEAELHPGVAENPWLVFAHRPMRSGTYTLEWTDDAGERFALERSIEVEPA